jgi:hypothetical protein
MAEKAYFKAPGSSGGSLHLPGRGSFPAVDDHLVVPEITRDQIIGGRRVIASPANPPHATKQVDLDYLLRAHVAPGYEVAADLLTRHAVDSDFASNACIYKEGTDPATGTRHLEEMAFEVVAEQNEKDATEKALLMQRRGVRRIFGLWVKGRRRLCEWSSVGQAWLRLDPDAQLEDPCLAAPLPISALLDAAAADNAVQEALIAKGNPAFRKREAAAEARGEARGKAAGRAEAILSVLDARGLAVSPERREAIASCRDLDRLDRWLRRAALATSADEITSEA